MSKKGNDIGVDPSVFNSPLPAFGGFDFRFTQSSSFS